MAITQLSVFLENKLGRLQEAVLCLGKNQINIRALSLADTAEYGILRIIVNDVEKATAALKNGGLSVKETIVLGIEVEDHPGGLAGVLDILTKNQMSVEYIYAFVEKSNEKAIVVFKVEDAGKAEKALSWNNIRVLGANEIRTL